MATITEDYVSFEIAKLLKEKGFDELGDYYYTKNGEFTDCLTIGYVNGGDRVICKNHTLFPYKAPTLQMAMKWLREKYNIYISIQPDFPSDKDYKNCWCWSASILHENCISTKGSQCYIETYEEATEAAIKYCLEHLI